MEYRAQKKIEIRNWVSRKTKKIRRERERVERQKPCTFATKLVKKKVQTSDGKVSGACFVFPATNRHKWSLILPTNPSTSLTEPCWWEYAEYSKIKTDEISGTSSSNRPTQNSWCKHYWCYVFPKASSKFT